MTEFDKLTLIGDICSKKLLGMLPVGDKIYQLKINVLLTNIIRVRYIEFHDDDSIWGTEIISLSYSYNNNNTIQEQAAYIIDYCESRSNIYINL